MRTTLKRFSTCYIHIIILTAKLLLAVGMTAELQMCDTTPWPLAPLLVRWRIYCTTINIYSTYYFYRRTAIKR